MSGCGEDGCSSDHGCDRNALKSRCCQEEEEVDVEEEGVEEDSNYESNHACCNTHSTAEEEDDFVDLGRGGNGLICLALVNESGDEVSIIDAKSEVRSFSLFQRIGQGGDVRKLCFSSHGYGGTDDLLTPCLDDDGCHGVPDEGCFCGLTEPHIHAHFHDPKLCNHHQKRNNNGRDPTGAELMKLARLTLRPTTATASGDDSTISNNIFRVPESAFMRTMCNSQDYTARMDGHLREPLLKKKTLHKVQVRPPPSPFHSSTHFHSFIHLYVFWNTAQRPRRLSGTRQRDGGSSPRTPLCILR